MVATKVWARKNLNVFKLLQKWEESGIKVLRWHTERGLRPNSPDKLPQNQRQMFH